MPAHSTVHMCCTLPPDTQQYTDHRQPPLTGAATWCVAGLPPAKKARSETTGGDPERGPDPDPDRGTDPDPERQYPSDSDVATSLDLRSPATLSLTQPPPRASSSDDEVSVQRMTRALCGRGGERLGGYGVVMKREVLF